jgi:hypothetical protein
VCTPGCPVAELDAQSGTTRDGVAVNRNRGDGKYQAPSCYGEYGTKKGADIGYGGQGGASRFFPVFRYQAKAPSRERPSYVRDDVTAEGNVEGGARPEHFRCTVCGRTKSGRNTTDGPCVCAEPQWEQRGSGKVAHPTVKPLELMRWLVRLVTPPGGVVLDPFAGSGTTVEAALLEGFDVIAVEREADYLPLIQQRIQRAHTHLAAQQATADQAAPGLFDLPAEEVA